VNATILVRADSAFFSAKVVKAIRAGGAQFSITVGNTTRIRAAISQIPETAWKPIKYRDAVWDEAEHRWVSEAEIAEIRYAAFASKAKRLQVTARLIVRRVKRAPWPAVCCLRAREPGWARTCGSPSVRFP
jgi:hypothetical protein